jgi:hypothetical protein
LRSRDEVPLLRILFVAAISKQFFEKLHAFCYPTWMHGVLEHSHLPSSIEIPIMGDDRPKRYRVRLPANFGRALLLMLLALPGCGEEGHVRVSDKELPGTYVASFETGKEQLILRSDKTYEQIFSSPTKKFTNRGTWETKYVLLEGTDIELIHANCSEDRPLPTPDCSRNLGVHREGGKLKLALNEAADWYYQRED